MRSCGWQGCGPFGQSPLLATVVGLSAPEVLQPPPSAYDPASVYVRFNGTICWNEAAIQKWNDHLADAMVREGSRVEGHPLRDSFLVHSMWINSGSYCPQSGGTPFRDFVQSQLRAGRSVLLGLGGVVGDPVVVGAVACESGYQLITIPSESQPGSGLSNGIVYGPGRQTSPMPLFAEPQWNDRLGVSKTVGYVIVGVGVLGGLYLLSKVL